MDKGKFTLEEIMLMAIYNSDNFDLSTANYWSSREATEITTNYVYFLEKSTGHSGSNFRLVYSGKTAKYYVRCVRDN